MYLLGIFVIAAFICFIIIKNNKLATGTETKKERSISPKGIGKNFLPSMPNGYQIFTDNYPIAGMLYRKDEAIKFSKSSDQELKLQREPSNVYDANAIKLIGVSASGDYLIGYLPKELSEQIIETGLFECVKVRLKRIYIGNYDFLDIQYQIIGPKEEKKKFDEFLSNKPAQSEQKDYLAYFELPIPKSLTLGQAEQAIFEHMKNSNSFEQQEWDSYSSILEEFNDEDFRESYDLKKVSKTILLKAMKQLMVEDKEKNYQYLNMNIDEVVDRIIEINPDLEK